MMGTFKYIRSVAASNKAVTTILTTEKPVIGVKCLGVDIGTPGGTITLVAISAWDGNTYLFDVKLCPAIMYEGGVLRLIQSTELLKVFHNCGPDSAALHHQYAVTLRNFYDTQIAHSVVMESKGLSPRRVSLPKMCEAYSIPPHVPPPDLQRLLAEDNNVWARRPCTKAMQETAASFARPLVPHFFTKTDSCIPEGSEKWFTHLCEENRLSQISNRRGGSRSKTTCPKNRRPTSSVHLVPSTQRMHFCQ